MRSGRGACGLPFARHRRAREQSFNLAQLLAQGAIIYFSQPTFRSLGRPSRHMAENARDLSSSADGHRNPDSPCLSGWSASTRTRRFEPLNQPRFSGE
jgi:hypothetical protein